MPKRSFNYLASAACSLSLPLLMAEPSNANVDRQSTAEDEIRESLAYHHALARSWFITYESDPRNLPDGTRAAVLRRSLAVHEDRLMHFSAKATAEYDWRVDPLQQQIWLLDDRGIISYPGTRAFRPIHWPRTASLPGTLSEEFFFAATGWWPFETRPTPITLMGAPVAVSAVLKDSNYKMRPDMELVDGVPCWVLERGTTDTIWLDPQRGLAILKREFGRQDGTLLQRITAHDFDEVAPGLWLAHCYTNVVFDPHTSSGDAPLVDSVLRVREVIVNAQLPEALFRFEPAAGALEIHEDHSFTQVVPGGEDYREQVVEWMRTLTEASAVRPDGPARATGGLAAALEWLIICLGALGVARHLSHSRQPLRQRHQ